MEQVSSKAAFLLGSFFDHEYVGDMFFSETSDDFKRSTWCYILEDRTPLNGLKYYNLPKIFKPEFNSFSFIQE
jgi:hypothetical protein